MRLFACLLISASVFAACLAGWFYWPVWQVESRVKSRLSDAAAVRFSSVVYNRKTGTACGYVNAQHARGGPAGNTHFILMPDGELHLDTIVPPHGSALQQLASLRQHADYLALAYARCGRG